MNTDRSPSLLGEFLGGFVSTVGAVVLLILPGLIAAGIALTAMTAGAGVEGVSGPAAWARAYPGRTVVVALASVALVEVVRRQVGP